VLDDLTPGTELELTTPFLVTMGSAPEGFVDAMLDARSQPPSFVLPPKLPQSMATEIRYVGLAVVGGELHRVQIVDHRGRCHIAIVHSDQLERSLVRKEEAS
jgi:hypothetical protein